LRVFYRAAIASFILTLFSTIHSAFYLMPQPLLSSFFRSEYPLSIHYKDIFCADFRVLTLVSLVLGFILYLTLYYAIFSGVRAVVGDELRYKVAMLVICIVGVIIPVIYGSAPGAVEAVSFYYPVFTIPNVLMEAGFRGILYCGGLTFNERPSITPNPLLSFILSPLIISPTILLAYLLHAIYRRLRQKLFLYLTILALAQFTALIPLTLLPSIITLIYLHFLAPFTGIILWATMGLAFLRLLKH